MSHISTGLIGALEKLSHENSRIICIYCSQGDAVQLVLEALPGELCADINFGVYWFFRRPLRVTSGFGTRISCMIGEGKIAEMKV